MARCERYLRNTRSSSPLLSYARDETSQGGEDGIIEEIFRHLPATASTTRSGRTCCEVGSWDGKWLSNTYSLLAGPQCWNGLLIEADQTRSDQAAEMYQKLGRLREKGKVGSRGVDGQGVVCVTELVSIDDLAAEGIGGGIGGGGTISTRSSLATIFDRVNIAYPEQVPVDFDLLSIDIDGNDLHVLEALLSDGRYRPKVVIVEFNPTVPNDVDFRQSPNMQVQQGASLRALTEGPAFAHGYCLVCTTTYNAFFVRVESMQYMHSALVDLPAEAHMLYSDMEAGIVGTSVISPSQRDAISVLLDALHSPSMVTGMFQTYEGEIKLVGPRKLLWHRLAINPQKMQVLPQRQRKFPFAPKHITGETSAQTKTVTQEIEVNSSKYGITRGREQDSTDTALKYARAVMVDIISDAIAVRVHLLTVVLPLLCQSLPIPRYQEQAFLLAMGLIAVIEQRVLSMSAANSPLSEPVEEQGGNAEEKDIDVYVNAVSSFSEALAGLFDQQAGVHVECEGEANVALIWLHRAVHVRTHARGPVAATATTASIARLMKLCRCCRLSGELAGYRHYAYELQAEVEVASVYSEKSGVQEGEAKGGGDEEDSGNDFISSARKEVTRMLATLASSSSTC